MRAALLTMLASCSFLVPPHAWHPTPDVGGWTCEARPFPIVDGVIGGALLATSLYADIRGQSTEPPSAFALAVAAYAALASLPWVAGAIYGGIRSASCSDELARHNAIYFRPR